MADDLRERLVPHPGELGAEREEVLRNFLRSVLPRRFEVSHGFMFDCSGKLSQQLDVIIADSLICPILKTPGGRYLFPCESVVAVGQVRSKLTSKREFRKALDNLESAKALDRSAGGRAFSSQYNEPIDHYRNHLHQIFTFLFITGASLKVETAQAELLDYVLLREPHLWPNMSFALDQYILTFCCDDGVCPNPMDARGVAMKEHSEDANLLLRFYLLLACALSVTRVSSMPYWEYLSSLATWDATVMGHIDGHRLASIPGPLTTLDGPTSSAQADGAD